MPKLTLIAAEKYTTRYPWFNLGYLDIYEHMCNMDKESSQVYLQKAALRVYSRKTLYDIYNSAPEHGTPSFMLEETEMESLDDTLKVGADKDAVKESYEDNPLKDGVEGDSLKVGAEESFSKEEVEGEGLKDSGKGEPNEEIILVKGEDNSLTMSFFPEKTPKYILAGGDYFSTKDFEEVILDREKPIDNFIAERPSLLRSAISKKWNRDIPVREEIEASELFDDATFYTETLAGIYIEQGLYKRAIDIYAKLILLYPEKSSYFDALVKEVKEKYNI